MKTRCALLVMTMAWVLCIRLPGVSAADAADAAHECAATLATVSGTIRRNGTPLAGVQVRVWWETGGDGRTTRADGKYSVASVPTGGWVAIAVLPPMQMRLAFRYWGTQPVSGDVVKDFALEPGYLLSGELRRPDGQRHDAWLGLGTTPHQSTLPQGEWLGADVEDGRFEVVLPPDVYSLHALVPPFYLPRTAVDLREADRTGLVITLLDQPEPPFPTDPPRADLISISAPDAEGNAIVSGAPGAVMPFSGVAIVNLNARNLAITHSDAAGGFSAELFAPPGSWLWIKYDPDGTRTNQLWLDAQPGVMADDGTASYVGPLPGAILPVGTAGTASNREHTFSSVGALGGQGQEWTGWWLNGILTAPSEGTGPGLEVRRGDLIQLSATVHFRSSALNCSAVPEYALRLDVGLRHLFDAGGWTEESSIWFNADLFTPTGLPIEREGLADARGVGSVTCPELTCISPHVLEGHVDLMFEVPYDLPDGTYGVFAWVDGGGIPLGSEEPRAIVWYQERQLATLPLLKVGSPAPARIPWVLLADYPLNGHRGVIAREDSGHYALPTRPIYPPAHVVVPRLDERSGQPMAYRLEPGSNWLSSTDRRLPCPPAIPLALPSGTLTVRVQRPDGVVDVLGPAPIRQSSVHTPTTPGGAELDEGTGNLGDLFHLATLDDRFAYTFTQDGPHVITLEGEVRDMFGNTYAIMGTYDVDVARILDLDPGQLPTTPYKQGDAFSPGLHVYPPVPADVAITLVQMPNSDPARAITQTISGRANRFGYFQPEVGTEIRLSAAGEFRVDYTAVYTAADGTRWAGALSWGNVIEGLYPQMEAHGRRGMDYHQDRIDDMPAWFEVFHLPAEKVGIEVYYPYFSGDVHWGIEDGAPGDSIHSIITVKDLTGSSAIYNALRASWPRSCTTFRWPPDDTSAAGLEKRLAVGEAPLVITTSSGKDPSVAPSEIDQWGYWYGSSERPDVHVRELVSEDNMGTAYWRFNDTYGYQIGEPADGDHPGDIKWEFGGAVLRVPSRGIHEYTIYSSLWVLLPYGDPVGARVTPPFQDATGASISGGPILTLRGQDVDMLFLPKGVRPGDVLEVGDVVAFSGHVGPPLDSRVAVTVTSPSGVLRSRVWHANKIGWLYDPAFDFAADEAGVWTVEVSVVHDRPYVGNGVTPQSHNRGTVLGTSGYYEFYVVPKGSPRLSILNPPSGFLRWPAGVEGMNGRIKPIEILGIAPPGASAVHYTIHDKGIVMGQGSVVPDQNGAFAIRYDAKALHEEFSMLSLTAHEGRWEGLADEVTINLLAVGGRGPQGNTVTLIGEEAFVGSDARPWLWLPVILKRLA
jgi:hypothetical protein